MESMLVQLGVGGIFALMVLKTVFDFLDKRKNGGGKQADYLRLQTRIKDLWEWHKPNADGEQPWKNTHMVTCIEKLTESVDNTNVILSRLLPLLERLEQLERSSR